MWALSSPSVSTTMLGITSFSTSQFVWRAGLQFISNSHTYQDHTKTSSTHTGCWTLITTQIFKIGAPTLKSSSIMKSQPIKSNKPSRQCSLDLTAKKHCVMICCIRFWYVERKNNQLVTQYSTTQICSCLQQHLRMHFHNYLIQNPTKTSTNEGTEGTIHLELCFWPRALSTALILHIV